MIASPCINLCQMDAASGLCRGCFRTLDEITRWARTEDADRLAIIAATTQRRENDSRQSAMRADSNR